MAGCALFVIGMLFLIPSGLCTTIGLVGLVVEMVSDPASLVNNLDDMMGFAAITLVPLAIGIGLVMTALRLRRNR